MHPNPYAPSHRPHNHHHPSTHKHAYQTLHPIAQHSPSKHSSALSQLNQRITDSITYIRSKETQYRKSASKAANMHTSRRSYDARSSQASHSHRQTENNSQQSSNHQNQNFTRTGLRQAQQNARQLSYKNQLYLGNSASSLMTSPFGLNKPILNPYEESYQLPKDSYQSRLSNVFTPKETVEPKMTFKNQRHGNNHNNNTFGRSSGYSQKLSYDDQPFFQFLDQNPKTEPNQLKYTDLKDLNQEAQPFQSPFMLQTREKRTELKSIIPTSDKDKQTVERVSPLEQVQTSPKPSFKQKLGQYFSKASSSERLTTILFITLAAVIFLLQAFC